MLEYDFEPALQRNYCPNKALSLLRAYGKIGQLARHVYNPKYVDPQARQELEAPFRSSLSYLATNAGS